jgi:glutaminase
MSASIGDLNSIIILESKGVDLNSYDYDKRTALHLACSECHINVIEYLLKKKVDKKVVDRWNNTPLDDLNKYKNNLIDDGTPIYKSNILKCEEIIKLLTI